MRRKTGCFKITGVFLLAFLVLFLVKYGLSEGIDEQTLGDIPEYVGMFKNAGNGVSMAIEESGFPDDVTSDSKEDISENVSDEKTVADDTTTSNTESAEPEEYSSKYSPATKTQTLFDIFSIPQYSGNPYYTVNDNIPFFEDDEIYFESYEYYSDLDSLGRCGTCVACLGRDLMPEAERESIAEVEPTGWQTAVYEGLIDNDGFLYNRCHLLGYQLTAENANEKNLITGTRYMNTEGMEPLENSVASYIRSSGNHVMYRVTPIFIGGNLVADGVLMEAYSVEDNGEAISFCKYCYNVQPKIEIDYLNGDNHLVTDTEPEGNKAEVTGNAEKTLETAGIVAAGVTKTITSNESVSTVSKSYIANKNSDKFHYASCRWVKKMNDSNKVPYTSRESAISDGYIPCKVCKP